MKIATIIIRSLLGLAFVVFGVNILHPFLPMPTTQPPPLAGDFMKALGTTHYMWVIGCVQVVGGFLLLIGRFIGFGLVLLGAVIVNILCFHIFLNPEGLPIAILVAVLALFLLVVYHKSFASLFNP